MSLNARQPDEALFVPHGLPEQRVDLGEITMNYAVAGAPEQPALLLVPPQTNSWWCYEHVMGPLSEHFQVFAVDLRGQGRSSRTPGRYTLDTMGNDLVRFIDLVVGRPVVASGNSSGGVLTAWLAAYAKPGQVRGVVCEDPPLFASEVRPPVGPGIDQAVGPLFALMAKYLGDQWSIGDWDGMVAAVPDELPGWIGRLAGGFGVAGGGPSQSLKEYDPEWGRAFATGTFYAPGAHERMLAAVRVPVLFTHHFRAVDEGTGALMGASADLQVERVRQLVTGAGQPFDLVSLPATPHSLHGHDPDLYAGTLLGWAETLPPA